MTSSASSWSSFLLPEKGKRWLVLMVLHMSLSALIGWWLPTATQEFYRGFNGPSLTPFWWIGGLLAGEYINRLGYQLSSYKFIQHLLTQTRSRVYGRWMRSPLKVKRVDKTGDEFPMGEVLARVMNDSDAVRELVTSGTMGILVDAMFILAGLAGFLRLDAHVGWGLLASEVFACVLLVWGSRKMGAIFMSVRTSTGILSRVVTDVTGGLRELAYTPHRHYASARGEAASEDFLRKQLKANVWDSGYYSAAESLYPILLALVLVFFPGGQAARVALLATLIDLIQKSITPIKEVAGKISNLQRARTGLERIREFHAYFPENEKEGDTELIPFTHFRAEVVHFSHPARAGETPFSLRDIHLEGEPGQLVGIVGASGCGKSTLLRLLSGQHGLFEGAVWLGDEKLDGEDAQAMRQLAHHVGLVSQDSHVFTATLEFNIALEESHGDFAAFWQQAKTALPYLEKWGITPASPLDPKQLSLGQKQLLSGLRACFLRKPIALFDEVSSGLDPELEHALRDLVRFVQRRSLTLIVTHRLETILAADILVLMDAGKVVDQGSAAELRNRSALFREFLEHLHSNS